MLSLRRPSPNRRTLYAVSGALPTLVLILGTPFLLVHGATRIVS